MVLEQIADLNTLSPTATLAFVFLLLVIQTLFIRVGAYVSQVEYSSFIYALMASLFATVMSIAIFIFFSPIDLATLGASLVMAMIAIRLVFKDEWKKSVVMLLFAGIGQVSVVMTLEMSVWALL